MVAFKMFKLLYKKFKIRINGNENSEEVWELEIKNDKIRGSMHRFQFVEKNLTDWFDETEFKFVDDEDLVEVVKIANSL